MDIGIALAEQGEGGLVDVVVDEYDGSLSLLDKVRDLHVGIENLSVVEDAFNRWKRGTDEEVYFFSQIGYLMFQCRNTLIDDIAFKQIILQDLICSLTEFGATL